MKNVLAMSLAVLIMGCTRGKESNDALKNFNTLAAHSFKINYSDADLDPLEDQDKCILRVTIENYLDELNDWATIVVDSFYVRSYRSGDLDGQFSFVSTKQDKFYFLFLPKFQSYQYSNDHYTRKELGNLTLKDSTGNYIVSIYSPMVEKFFNEEVLHTKSLKDQFMQADHLLRFMFKDVFMEELLLPRFLDSLQTRPASHYAEIMKVLNPIVLRNQPMGFENNHISVFWNQLGLVVVDYTKNDADPKRLKLDIHFIPHEERPFYGKEIDVRRFDKCFE